MAAIELTQAEAHARLASITSASCEPLLDDTELDDLLALSKRPDQYGLEPPDTGWTPTWELNAGAAEGWRRKAAKAAGTTSFSADGASYQAGDLHEQCLRMAERYEARIVTVQTGPVDDLAYIDALGNF